MNVFLLEPIYFVAARFPSASFVCRALVSALSFLLFSGGSSHPPLLVSAAAAGVVIRPPLFLLAMKIGAQHLVVHHSFRCRCSVLQLLALQLSNLPSQEAFYHHRRRHLFNFSRSSPMAIVWFDLLALCRRLLFNATLFLRLFNIPQAQLVSLDIP